MDAALARAAARAARAAARKWPGVPPDDMEAEALADLHLGLPQFDPQRGEFAGWAHSVAAHACRRYARWWRRGGLRLLGAAAPPAFVRPEWPLAAPAGPERMADDEWAALLRPLRERDRQLLLALHRDGRTPAELVPEFGPTPAAVSMAGTLARRRLAGGARGRKAE